MSRAADLAYAEIRTLILSGEAPPGTRLKEEELADLVGVSRTPVRDALRRLEAEMFVTRTDTSRTHVADWHLEDVDELFMLRGMLEAHAAARAATRIDGTAIAGLRAWNDRIDAAVSAAVPEVGTFIEANRAFHATIIDAAASPRLKGALALVIEQPIVRRTAQHYSAAALGQSLVEHRELIQAFEARDPEWARAVMTGHIRRAYHAFTDAIRRLSPTSDT
jgi:DNA-binding GntR family transcriptional regulator